MATVKLWCNNCGTVTRFSVGKNEPDGRNVCQICKNKIERR